MGVSSLLCLLPALLATASVQAQITCRQCSALGNDCPSPGEPTTTCSVPTNKDGCYTMVEDSTLEGTPFKEVSKGCISNFDSGQQGEFTFTLVPGRYMRISIKKCNTELCNKDPLAAPTEDTTPNGLQCPSCLTLDSQTCIPITIPCKGKETLCIDLTGNFNKGAGSPETPFVAQGCASPSMEFITKSLPVVWGKFRITEASTKKAMAVTNGASPAPGKVPFALFLPGLTGLLLVKLLS